MFQRRPPEEPPDWIGQLVKWAILALVFIAPIVKGLIQTLMQRRAAAQKARGLGTGAETPSEGRKTWDDLVAGRSARPATRVPPPRPTPIEVVEPEPLSELPSRSAPPLPPGVQDEEDLVEEEVAERDRAEAQRQLQAAAASAIAPAPVPAPAPAPAPQSAADRWLFPAAAAGDRKAALARAIVLREVLGPPLALRRVEEPWSATG